MVGLIGNLDVEEQARAKDSHARGNEGGSSAHVMQNLFSNPTRTRA